MQHVATASPSRLPCAARPVRPLPAACLLLTLLLTTAHTAAAAGPTTSLNADSADVKIQTMSVASTASGGSIITQTQITLQNDNDDDARNVELVITLPPTTHVIASSAGAVPGPTYPDPNTRWPVIGYVTFSLATLGVGQTASMSITTEMLAAAVTSSTTIGAFVFGSLPDPNGGSNFKALPVGGI